MNTELVKDYPRRQKSKVLWGRECRPKSFHQLLTLHAPFWCWQLKSVSSPDLLFPELWLVIPSWMFYLHLKMNVMGPTNLLPALLSLLTYELTTGTIILLSSRFKTCPLCLLLCFSLQSGQIRPPEYLCNALLPFHSNCSPLTQAYGLRCSWPRGGRPWTSCFQSQSSPLRLPSMFPPPSNYVACSGRHQTLNLKSRSSTQPYVPIKQENAPTNMVRMCLQPLAHVSLRMLLPLHAAGARPLQLKTQLSCTSWPLAVPGKSRSRWNEFSLLWIFGLLHIKHHDDSALIQFYDSDFPLYQFLKIAKINMFTKVKYQST